MMAAVKPNVLDNLITRYRPWLTGTSVLLDKEKLNKVVAYKVFWVCYCLKVCAFFSLVSCTLKEEISF